MKLIDVATITTAIILACLMGLGFSLVYSVQENHEEIQQSLEDIKEVLIETQIR